MIDELRSLPYLSEADLMVFRILFCYIAVIFFVAGAFAVSVVIKIIRESARSSRRDRECRREF